MCQPGFKRFTALCEDLAREVHFFFKNSATNIQEMFSLETHNILYLAQTRWLSYHQLVNRIFDRAMGGIEGFFFYMAVEEKNVIADRTFQYFQDPPSKIILLVFLD